MIAELLTNKCPNCKEGKVFEKDNLFTYRPNPMHEACPVCKADFKKEPGFYWGAMYASYGLAVGELLLLIF